MYTINDPVFGKLERHGSTWQGSVWVEHFQKELELELVYRDENSPSPEEQSAFIGFLKIMTKDHTRIEKALLDWLLESAQKFVEMDETIPIPVSVCQVWETAEPIRIWVDIDNYDSPCVTLLCDFTWDEEHGLDIDFLDDQIGIGEGGCHWANKSHYALDKTPN
jgi:hypothetical protein